MNITNQLIPAANSGMHSTEIYSAKTGINHNFTNRNVSTIHTLADSLSSPTFFGPLVSTALSDRIVVDKSQTDKCTLQSGSSNSQSINDPDYINTIGETFRDSDVYADCIETPGDESSPNDIIPEVMARMPGNKGILKGRSLMVEQGSVTKLYAHNTPAGGQVLAHPVSGSSENTVFIRLDPGEKGDSMYQKILSAANNTNPSEISIDDINKLRQNMARFIRDNPELAEDANDALENDPFYKLTIDEAVDTYQNAAHSEDSIYTHQSARPWLEPLMHMFLTGVGPAIGNLFKGKPVVGQFFQPEVTSVAIHGASVGQGFKNFMNDRPHMDKFITTLDYSTHQLNNKALYCNSNNVKPTAPPVAGQASSAESVPSTETGFFKNSLGAAFDILSGMDSFLRFPMAGALPHSETENPTTDTTTEFTSEAELDCAVVAKKYDSVAENTLERCMHIEILRDNPWMLSKLRDIVENTTEYQPSLIISFSELVSNLGRKDEYTADKLVSLKTGYLEAMSEKKLNLLESAREAGKITTRTHDMLTDYLELFKQRLNENDQPALDTQLWFKSEFDGIHLLIPYTMDEVLSGAISGLDPVQFLAPPAVQPFINYLTRENATELIEEAYEKIQSTADIADALASEIDENNLRSTLQSLLMHGPRHVDNPPEPDNFDTALQEVKANISALGLPVYQQDFNSGDIGVFWIPPMDTSNLFTFIPGKSKNVVTTGAHLDSIRTTVGANDNGSGVVSLLETIRILSESDVEFENPVLFCFWALEEYGLIGSYYFTNVNSQEVLNHFTNGTSGEGNPGRMAIKCNINLDMVGSKDNGNSANIIFDDPDAPRIHELMKDRELIEDRRRLGWGTIPKGTKKLSQMFANYFEEQSIPFVTSKPVYSSDQNRFHSAGIPAIHLFTAEDKCYHKACDDINNIDFTKLTNCTIANTNIITQLAMERENWFLNP